MTNVPPSPPKLLIISHDTVGQYMAGPGIRYYHIARELARYVDTTLAIPAESPAAAPEHAFPLVRYTRGDWATLAPHVQRATILLFPSDTANEFPALATSNAYLIVDGYDPLMAEWLALSGHIVPAESMAAWNQRLIQLARQYMVGDLFICASERQRDWWLGLLEANGRINPATFQADPSLRNLIDVVPYGLSASLPQPTRPVIKGVWPGIQTTDKVLLWGGGLWPWLDPLTAIRAVAKIRETRPDVKLIFPGTKHPNPRMDGMPTQNAAAMQLAESLGLRDQGVFFGDWVAYADWANVLLESDVALTLHYATLETRLAFRSRVLEYIWAGLPVVATRGDATSELLTHYQLGLEVADGDVDGVAQAIQQLLDQPPALYQARVEAARRALTWERAVAPLIAFCQAPWHAADKPSVGKLEHPLYSQLRNERDYWQKLAEGYAHGRVMRVMLWLQQLLRSRASA